MLTQMDTSTVYVVYGNSIPLHFESNLLLNSRYINGQQPFNEKILSLFPRGFKSFTGLNVADLNLVV